MKQGIWFGWATVPLFLLAIPLAPWLFRGTGDNAGIVRQEVIYFQVARARRGAAGHLRRAMSSFYTGRGLTRIVMLVNCAGTLLDIFARIRASSSARWGFPELGIAGAG